MKGYYNNSGYMGYVGGRWVLFACEQDYVEYMEGWALLPRNWGRVILDVKIRGEAQLWKKRHCIR